MTRAEVKNLIEQTFVSCHCLYDAGQQEYAHDPSNALANFDRAAALLGLHPAQVLLVFLQKHIDGLAAWAAGHKSQREGVEGRIGDAIVYLVLFRALVAREEGIDE